MKLKMKKFIAILLLNIALIIALCPTSAFAASYGIAIVDKLQVLIVRTGFIFGSLLGLIGIIKIGINAYTEKEDVFKGFKGLLIGSVCTIGGSQLLNWAFSYLS